MHGSCFRSFCPAPLGEGDDLATHLGGAGVLGRQGDIAGHETGVGVVVERALVDGGYDGRGIVGEQRGHFMGDIEVEAPLLVVGVPVVGVQVHRHAQQSRLVDDRGVVSDDVVGRVQGIGAGARNGDDAGVVEGKVA